MVTLCINLYIYKAVELAHNEKGHSDLFTKGDVTPDNSQRRFLAQHGYADDFSLNFCVASF